MKNLEQIRAKHAHEFWDPLKPTPEIGAKRLEKIKGENGGNVVSGLGSMIVNNGLLATLAFAKAKTEGYETFAKEIGRFLSSTGPDGRRLLKADAGTLDRFIAVLTDNDSLVLQQATTEALAYLNYLKRFAQ